jgi:hypothetical protein
MFRILCGPSSGITELCLTGITRSDSEIFVVCLIAVWQRNFELTTVDPAGRTVHTHTPQVQKYAAKHRSSTRQNIRESLRVISVKHSSVLPDDGSCKIRNMSESFLIF